MRTDDFSQSRKVYTHFRLIYRVMTSDFYAGNAQKTCGETAEVPFCADVRPRPNEDFEAVLCGKGEKSFEIALPRSEVEFAFFNFVQVPKDVNAQRVEAECFDGEHSVFPILFGDAWIVQLSRPNGAQLQNIIYLNIAWIFLVLAF